MKEDSEEMNDMGCVHGGVRIINDYVLTINFKLKINFLLTITAPGQKGPRFFFFFFHEKPKIKSKTFL